MKPIAAIFFFFIISFIACGQTDINKRRSVFFETAGSGGLGSINYEKLFHQNENIEFTWRAGISIAPIDRNNGVGIVFPLMVNGLFGKRAHKLELGLGQGVTITTKGSGFILATAAIGYRYQHESKKWFYRITYTPLISYLIDFQVQQWAGVSIGYTLTKKEK